MLAPYNTIQYQAIRVNQSKKQKGGKQDTREARASGNLGKTKAAGTVKCEYWSPVSEE